MKNEINADYSKRYLFPPSLEDWVPDGHPARFIREFVDNLDLFELGFRERKIVEGRPNYSNNLLLKIWLYGYFEKIYSTRQLEKACIDRVALIWLTGRIGPDHNTIWRFFKKNKGKIKNVFKKTVHIAINTDMVGFALQAVDGTKIYANASINKAMHKDDLQKLLKKVEISMINEVVKEINDTERRESSRPSYLLPKKLQDKNALSKAITEGLEKYSELEKQELKERVQANIQELDDKKKKSLSMTDPESRMMKNKSSKDYCYNAQAVVDGKSQIIVGSKVTNDEDDHHQMTKMINESEINCKKQSETTLADGGYFSGSEFKKAEEEGYSVITPVDGKVGKSTKKGQDLEFAKDKFIYDPKEDVYICPMGKKLKYMSTLNRKSRSYPIMRYGCKDYKDCPSRDKCYRSKGGGGRKIDRTAFDDAIYRQNKKNSLDENKEIYKKRKGIVEPVFGWIKHNNGFNRWLYRGLKNVDAQWNLICTGINLHKLFKVWKENGLKLG
ncbi:MAG: IS1182 family transposase [Thermodesulfobacteriota bacterium]|nr:IS1182 family transposase [Thermodesulfobacteriota bacterium]